MENKIFRTIKAALPASGPSEQPIGQALSKKRFGKKLYVAVAAIIAIAVILSAVMFVPSSNADVISLGVHYSAGEKLTYDVTTSTSSQSGNTSTNLSAQSTLTVEVISLVGDTYTLNYTTTSSVLGYSMTTSRLMEVKETDMVNLLTLLPVALQQYATPTNNSNPVETAVFNQTQAKVGDEWQIPLTTTALSSSPASEINVKFVAIQELSVKAGTFKVFRLDFSQTTPEQNQARSLSLNFDVSGQSYLEMGTCKQIQSTVELTMSSSSQLGTNANYNTLITFTSTLVKDQIP